MASLGKRVVERFENNEKLAEQRHQDMQRQQDKLDKWLRVLTTGVISMVLALLASLIVDRLAPGAGSMAAAFCWQARN